jgi:hypothetical protein
MGQNGPEGGRDAIERTMREGFWKTGRPLQHLHYEHVEVKMLGEKYALVTGEYVLTGGERADHTGWLSTVWQRTREGWRMIHDHSQALTTDMQAALPNETLLVQDVVDLFSKAHYIEQRF